MVQVDLTSTAQSRSWCILFSFSPFLEDFSNGVCYWRNWKAIL